MNMNLVVIGPSNNGVLGENWLDEFRGGLNVVYWTYCHYPPNSQHGTYLGKQKWPQL